jgi:hypothetical protein
MNGACWYLSIRHQMSHYPYLSGVKKGGWIKLTADGNSDPWLPVPDRRGLSWKTIIWLGI